MANRADQFDPSNLINDEIDALFGTANPNPDRIGCPPKEVLTALAARERPMDDPAYEHLTQCSPCYLEFRSLQQAVPSDSEHRLSALPFAAAAALVLALVAGVWWYLYSPPPSTAEFHVQLDLRPYAVVRSEQEKAALPPLALPTQRLSLTVQLPTGSEPGNYEVRLLDRASTAVAAASGLADLREFVTTLQAAIDLRSVQPGEYRLALRREGESWVSYRAIVK